MGCMMTVNEILREVRDASRQLALLTEEKKNSVLCDVAAALRMQQQQLLSANAGDLSRMDAVNPKYDRLLLTEKRLEAMAVDIEKVAGLPSPLGKVREERVLPNGLHISRVSVPLGVIGVIYEARPNVTADVFSLCFKSGSACVLKGGSEAAESNAAIVGIIHEVLERHELSKRFCVLLDNDRAHTHELLTADKYVNVLIPRGSAALIEFVRKNATVPVIETGAGICHTYFDERGDIEKGKRIIFNAKTRRVSVCNALDCLVVHAARLHDLPELCAPLAEKKVLIYADERARAALHGKYPSSLLSPAEPEHFGTEFLDYKMAVKTVDSFEEALSHIYTYSSKHSECIITEDSDTAERFIRSVDAACVYSNAATSFTDGAQFGLGAEIGISTQKLHARGPMGLEEITSYKWVIRGNGQIRES